MILIGKEAVKKYIVDNQIKHFKPEEFECKHCGKVIIDSQLIDILEKLREYLGKPVIITSAYRCIEWNRQIGGVKGSAHIRGYAVDVKVLSSRTRYRIVNFLLSQGISRIGIAQNFIHFDIDPEKPKNVIWHYFNAKHVA